MPSDNTGARVSHRPSHGGGNLRLFAPGRSGNPGGRPTNYHQARRALQEWASTEGVRRLIELAASPDDRVASVAVLGIFDRAYGKPKEFDPSEERRPLAINTSVLTTEEKHHLLALLRRGLVKEAAPAAVPDTGEQIEGRVAAPSRQCP